MLRRRDPVERAREALEAGAHSRAIRFLWRGSTRASRELDAERLEALVAIATSVAERARGRDEREALIVLRYATRCLEDAREGVRPTGGALGQLLDLRKRMP